jgi:hypothetical protein
VAATCAADIPPRVAASAAESACVALAAEGTVPSEPSLIFAPEIAPFLIFAAVTAPFLICRVPTLFLPREPAA